MKKYFFVLAPALIFVITASFVFENNHKENLKGKSLSFKEAAPMPANNNIEKGGHSCCGEMAPGKYSTNSIYNLEDNWKNQDGQNVKLDYFSGKNIVLAMIYTSCPTACPVIVNEMQNLQAKIPPDKIKNYKFILVSIDPKRDTPAQLKKYADARNLNPEIWTLLTGSENQVAELAQAIGFKYKRNTNRNFTHSNLITFLNRRGEIINQSKGLNQNISTLLSVISK